MGLIVLIFWAYRHHFVYRGAQPAGEGHPETTHLKQVLIAEDRRPFSFYGGISRNYYAAAQVLYFGGSYMMVALFYGLVPDGMTLGRFLTSQAGLGIWMPWLSLLLALNTFHLAVVTKRLRSTLKSPWGMIATGLIPPLYWVNLIALGTGNDGVLNRDKGELSHD